MCDKMRHSLQITLNGDRFLVPDAAGALTVSELLSDQVEIVNFVGGG